MKHPRSIKQVFYLFIRQRPIVKPHVIYIPAEEQSSLSTCPSYRSRIICTRGITGCRGCCIGPTINVDRACPIPSSPLKRSSHVIPRVDGQNRRRQYGTDSICIPQQVHLASRIAVDRESVVAGRTRRVAIGQYIPLAGCYRRCIDPGRNCELTRIQTGSNIYKVVSAIKKH